MLEKMKSIIDKLDQADTAYYKYDAPIMPDRDYDQLYSLLQKLEQESGVILSGSPTQRVSGAVLDELVQVHHTKPMLSAKKTKEVSELLSFVDNEPMLVSWKLDDKYTNIDNNIGVPNTPINVDKSTISTFV